VVNYFHISESFLHCGFRGFVIPRRTGRLEYEIRFFSGDALVTSVQGETTVASVDPLMAERWLAPSRHLEGLAARYVDLLANTLNGSIYSDEVDRSDGRDWPANAHTMLGKKRLTHLRHCVETVLNDGVEGDFIETGVWKGGSCVLMRGILQAAGDTQRTVWVADSFQGLPKPAVAAHPLDEGDSLYIHQDLVIPMEQVKSTFRSYDLLDGQVAFLPGWYCDTLPKAPIGKLAILRMDGDMYESTIDALNALYHKLQPGGFCIIDDYGCIPACRAAVHDFRRQHGITAPIHVIDWTGAFWRKQNPA
jgi:O-methyltransferase